MQHSVWKYLETLSTLLDPDERQSILGDIQERGTSLRAALDLTALVLLRQLQCWKSWRPWALAAALYSPAHFAPFLAFFLPDTLYQERYRLSYGPGAPIVNLLGSPHVAYWEGVGAAILAWAAGFTIGHLGRRSASVLPLLALTFFWIANRFSRLVMDPDSTTLVLTATVLITLIPSLLGFLQGFQSRLHFLPAILLTALFIPSTTRFVPRLSLTFALTTWPLLYTLIASRPKPNRVIHNV